MIDVGLAVSWTTVLGFFTRLCAERSETSQEAGAHCLGAA